MSKKAILAVSFGTTYIDSLEKSISAVEKRFTADFPDYDVKRAFTSNIVRKKLLENKTALRETSKQFFILYKADRNFIVI